MLVVVCYSFCDCSGVVNFLWFVMFLVLEDGVVEVSGVLGIVGCFV